MSDTIASLAAYCLTAAGLWFFTRKSEDEHVREQWRKPAGALFRLGIIFVALHFLFVLCKFPTAIAFPVFFLFCLPALLADITGYTGLISVAFAYAFYEWVFWFPKSSKSILHRSISSELPDRNHLVGKRGHATRELRPTGHIEIDGVEHQARAEFGTIHRGDQVIVESLGEFELVVVPDSQPGKEEGPQRPEE